MFYIVLIYKKNISFNCCGIIPAVVPGLPFIGNLLQLKDKKIHQSFENWAEIYGPVYNIKVGALLLLLSSITLMLCTRFVLTLTNIDHKMARRHVVTHMLGAGAQRRHSAHRVIMMDNIVHRLQAHAKENPLKPVNFQLTFQNEIFGPTLKQ
ncbi:hypothetical protein MKW92_028010, partial [Papaver armeniacum]